MSAPDGYTLRVFSNGNLVYQSAGIPTQAAAQAMGQAAVNSGLGDSYTVTETKEDDWDHTEN